MMVKEALDRAGIRRYLFRFSALDRYFRLRSPYLHLAVEGSLIDLAKLFPDLRYPGIEGVDAELRDGQASFYFRCVDGPEGIEAQKPEILNFLYDPEEQKYLDPKNLYPQIKGRKLDLGPGDSAVPDLAAVLARYPFEAPDEPLRFQGSLLDPVSQRDLLLQILTGPYSGRGLEALMDSGFVAVHWPEIAALRDVTHSKEFHPEGDVWDHTLETFRYRKTRDLAVSLALLLHDVGKPVAPSQEGRRFDQHAEIGARIAEQFLKRLRFQSPLLENVVFLVHNHMLPGALAALPLYRTERFMSSDLFPDLLEVYRCDLSSTFRGPDGYYEACKVYRSFLKHRKNPFRKSDGKKLQRHEVSVPK